jgi:hypothetical protein
LRVFFYLYVPRRQTRIRSMQGSYPYLFRLFPLMDP